MFFIDESEPAITQVAENKDIFVPEGSRFTYMRMLSIQTDQIAGTGILGHQNVTFTFRDRLLTFFTQSDPRSRNTPIDGFSTGGMNWK